MLPGEDFAAPTEHLIATLSARILHCYICFERLMEVGLLRCKQQLKFNCHQGRVKLLSAAGSKKVFFAISKWRIVSNVLPKKHLETTTN